MHGKYHILTALLVILLLLASPVSAFSAKELTITVAPSGDATIDFRYELNWLENFAVFAKIADPAAELKSALESNFHKSVDVTRADTGDAAFIVHSYAAVTEDESGITYTTPALSFADAQRVLNTYWFAPLVSPDFSPDVTKVIFPDGTTQTYENVLSIPSLKTTVAAA